jgi:DNA-binding transcriptional LysR family regulator
MEAMRMFVCVVETGSFTKAAALARVTTPQVSRSVNNLESRHQKFRPALSGPADRALQRMVSGREFDLVLAQRTPNLIEEGFDVSIVAATALADFALTSQTLGVVHTVLCASPEYISRRGLSASVQELAKHTCLLLELPDVPHGHCLFDGAHGEVFRHPESTRLSVNVADALA